MRIIILLSFFAAFSPVSATAVVAETGAMTLEGVFESIRVSNPELSALRGKITMLEASILKASAYPNPSFETEQSQPDTGQSREMRLTQPFVLTNRRSLAKGVARSQLDAFKREISAKETALIAAAKKGYFAFRLAAERVRFEESRRIFTLNVLNKVQVRLMVGDARNVDVARANVELEQTRFSLEAAKVRMLLARAILNRTMGRRPDEPLSFPADDQSVLQPPEGGRIYSHYFAEALANRRDIQAAGLRRQAAEFTLRLERSRRLPDLAVGFALSREDDVDFNKFILGIELPIWYRNRGEIKSAQAEIGVRDEEKRGIERTVSYEVYSSWLGRNLARTRVSAMYKNVLAVDELREINSRDYLSGKIDLTAYYEGNRIFLEQNLNYLDALQEYHDKDVELEQVLSTSLRTE
ncbi:MAG: TolC family protein [bacterium]